MKNINLIPAPFLAYWLLFLLGIFTCNTTLAQNPGLGKISFPTSELNPKAQEKFIVGVLLLHSFEYEDAAEAFQAAQALSPDYAMAYWGEAMTHNHPIWMRQDPEKGRAALEKLGAISSERLAKAKWEKEKDFLRAVEILFGEGEKEKRDLAYSGFMGKMKAKYPDDHEVATFYAVSLLGTSHDGRNVSTYMKAASVAEEVFIENPDHPGALHYLIHSYDDPVHACLGLRAARRYARVASEAAHALHMPSHIFVAMGMWDEVVASNEVSYAASIERIRRKDLGIESRGYHSFWWLQYGYLQQGRFEKALVLLDSMNRDAKASKASRIQYHLATMRAAYLVETRDWQSAAYDMQPDFSDLSNKTRAIHEFTTGYVAFHRKDNETLKKQVDSLKTLEPGGGPKDDLAQCCALPTGKAANSQEVAAVTAMRQELQAMLLYASEQKEAAFILLTAATKTEEGMGFMFGPPVIVKPTHELLGEWLLEAGKVKEAKVAFATALERAPGRTLSVQGLEKANRMLE